MNGFVEFLTTVIYSMINAIFLRWLWNSSEKFKSIVEISYVEWCYISFMIIAMRIK